MRKLSQVLLVLTFVGLVSLSLIQKDVAFAAKEATGCSNLGNKVICPVMGGTFSITEESAKSEYKGKVYYFCCPGCKAPFEKNPEKYLKEEKKAH